MKQVMSGYFKTLQEIFEKVAVTDRSGKEYSLEEAVDNAAEMILRQSKAGGKLILIGNGASASIASHMAVDFWKNGGIRAMAFNDSALLTCISNDYGYEHVFEKPIEKFAEPGDILFAISSSGKSENILNGASAAREKRAGIITFSGFDINNPLRGMGDMNFYVPIAKYGYVEVTHHAICHNLVDKIAEDRSG